MVSLWCTLRCVIISDGSLYCGPWFVCNGTDLFHFIEIIFEFSIEYRVYDSGSKLFLGAWSPINSISLRGMSVMCGNKVSHTLQPPQFPSPLKHTLLHPPTMDLLITTTTERWDFTVFYGTNYLG